MPGARLEHAWSVEPRPGIAACYNYRTTPQGNFTLDRGVGPWAAAGKATPDKAAVNVSGSRPPCLCGCAVLPPLEHAVLVCLATLGRRAYLPQKLYAQLCGKDTAASSKAVQQALAAGGAAAQAAVAAIARGPCPADKGALEASFYRFVSLPELQNPKTALQ